MNVEGTIFDTGKERFNNVWNNKIYFPILENAFESVCNELEEKGIKHVHCFDSLGMTVKDIDCEELTLLVVPLLDCFKERSSSIRPEMYQLGLFNIDVEIFEVQDNILYIPMKNLLVCMTNIFRSGFSVNNFCSSFDSFYVYPKTLTESEKENYVLIRRWKINIATELQDLENSSNEFQQSIKDLEQTYLETIKLHNETNKKIDMLKNIRDDVKNVISKEIEKLKKNRFVKKLTVENNKLVISFGKIYLTGNVITGTKEKEGVEVSKIEKKKILIGDIEFHIDGNEIEVFNESLILNRYQHPHAAGGNMCAGKEKLNIQKLLGRLELNKLASFLYSWVYSYSPDNRPYRTLQDFYNIRKDQPGGVLDVKK